MTSDNEQGVSLSYEEKVAWACPGAWTQETERRGGVRKLVVTVSGIKTWEEALAVRKLLATLVTETEKVTHFFSMARKKKGLTRTYEVTAEVELTAVDTTDADLIRWGHPPR